jgi:ribokinase
MLDFVCIGNALIDAFLGIHEESAHCHINKDTNELCVKYGEKIPLESCEFLVGGNAANVSIGLKRLGIKSALMAEIGDDEFSLKIRNILAKEEVDRAYIKTANNTQSSFAIGINYHRERTLFVDHVKRKHEFSFENLDTKWFYLTSLGKEWEEAYKKVLNFATTNHIPISFNPGTPQLEFKASLIEQVLQQTQVLFVNKEEGLQLLAYFSNENPSEIKDIMVSLKKLGPKLIVLTDGLNGSFALDKSQNFIKCPIKKIPVIEKTGAGDAFASGFMAAFFNGEKVESSMHWGTLNSAAVIGQTGAQTGLLKKAELEKELLMIK